MEKLIGKKLKMTQLFSSNGDVIAITPIKIESGDLGVLKVDDKVKVSGISKGKGFQGTVKRHGFAGGPRTHGQKNRLRAPGSIGSTAPQRTLKGRRMAGHMGAERITIKGLKIVDVKQEEKIVSIKGAAPGNNGGKVEIVKL